MLAVLKFSVRHRSTPLAVSRFNVCTLCARTRMRRKERTSVSRETSMGYGEPRIASLGLADTRDALQGARNIFPILEWLSAWRC